MGNFAENLNLGNRFRPPLWKIQGKIQGKTLEKSNEIVRDIAHESLANGERDVGHSPPKMYFVRQIKMSDKSSIK